MNAIATVVRLFDKSDRPARDAAALLDVLAAQIAQREDIFAFGVIERIYERGIDQIDAIVNRIRLLIAAEIAIEAVFIVKVNLFGSGPNALVLLNLLTTALLFRAAGEADVIAPDPFAKACSADPWATRDALHDQLRLAIARNGRIARSHQRLFSLSVLVTIAALGWAFW